MSVPLLRARRQSSRPASFAAISKEVDPENEDLILHRRERLIPWSKSPFFDKLTVEYRKLREERRQSSYHGDASTPVPGRHAETYAGMLTADEIKDVDKSNDEERGERPPAWLDLFYDLAWASTFANLTQNNMISGGEESISYAVFFSMVWWMWISQVSYDIRFYSNDWFHRIFVFLQLCTFGALAAFTSKFDVTAFVGSDDKDPVQKALDDFNRVSPNQQLANDLAEQRIPEVSFFGIALVIGISRVLLCIQYIRVWLYAHDKRDPAVVVKPLAMFISAGLWCGSFAMLFTARYTNNAAHISKFIMWGVATAIEVAGHYFAPPAGHLRSMGSLTARLATLVTIILGEGLNGITGTLKFAATSLGFNFRCVALVLCTAVVVYLTFYLYFEGTRPRISKNRRSLWICLHLPYMLCVILLMEGLKNLLLYTILYTSLEFTITKFTTFLNDANQGDPSQMIDTLNKTMTPFLAKIGFSWDDGWKHVMETAGSGTQDEFENLFVGEMYRLLMNITVRVFKEFESDDQSPATELAILQYLRNDSVIHRDVLDVNLPEFGKVLTTMAEPHVQGARWINALAGGALICLALINITQSWPKDRYAWGSAISRFLNGTILLTLLFMNVDSGDYSMASSDGAIWAWLDSFWALPTLAFSLLAQAIVDHMLLVLAVRSADRALQRTYEPSMLDPLRDSKDHAYDPPQPSGASIATTYPPTPGTGGYKNTQSNWQPPYVPHTQQHPVYASPSEMGHQSSHGFVAPPPPPTLPFQATGGTGIPPGGIVTPSRPR
ncbi:Bacterial low temperature requirement A protein (LtrA) [Rhizoctonia solani]|uniref:Bacterial low temperature requirement A protein (LtrA) n=1 Tax=Rhizoctonia solani TaxID=456999 RepID=A0A8H7LGU2_9AGAM|nr:Bacterial low temperature requirement A protein (LtrA) [Rhizoctonia solani]